MNKSNFWKKKVNCEKFLSVYDSYNKSIIISVP